MADLGKNSNDSNVKNVQFRLSLAEISITTMSFHTWKISRRNKSEVVRHRRLNT